MDIIEVEKIKISERVEQGDIYSDVDYIEKVECKDGKVFIQKITFPYVVVLSQDCDLNQAAAYFNSDSNPSNQDKKLLSVIVAPLYNEDLFIQGEHLKDPSIQYAMRIFNKQSKGKLTTEYKSLIDNCNPRYHYFSFKEDAELPPMVSDFKHFFCVDIDYLNSCRQNKFVCKIKELYRESVTQRFSHFLSRIGLPS